MYPSSARLRFSLDSARAGGFSAQIGSAREKLEPACLAKIGLIQAEIDSLAFNGKSTLSIQKLILFKSKCFHLFRKLSRNRTLKLPNIYSNHVFFVKN